MDHPKSRICKFCSKEYIPNKYHVKTQLYCTDKKCRSLRNIERSAAYRKAVCEGKKTVRSRTEKQKKSYNEQRRKVRQASRLVQHAFDKKKQVFVAKARTLVSVLEFFLFTFIGIAGLCLDLRRRTSALGLQKLLRECYYSGVSHADADSNFNSHLEVLHELINELDSAASSADIAEAIQLAGPAPDP